MNRILAISLFAFALSLRAAFGAADDTLVAFSTPGPDRYADGTAVKDGECYALVWTRAGAAFAGISADGKAVGDDSKVLVYAPVAKGGRCPTVVFEIDAELAAAYAGGAYGVYLCDTRLADGRVGGLTAAGAPVAVNGWGKGSGEPGTGSGSSFVDLQAPASTLVSVTAKSELPADAPKPQVTSVRVVGANVVLTVKGTLPCLQYAASEVGVGGRAQDAGPGPSASAAAQGAATVDGEITVIVPKRGDSGFYRVGRR